MGILKSGGASWQGWKPLIGFLFPLMPARPLRHGDPHVCMYEIHTYDSISCMTMYLPMRVLLYTVNKVYYYYKPQYGVKSVVVLLFYVTYGLYLLSSVLFGTRRVLFVTIRLR